MGIGHVYQMQIQKKKTPAKNSIMQVPTSVKLKRFVTCLEGVEYLKMYRVGKLILLPIRMEIFDSNTH